MATTRTRPARTRANENAPSAPAVTSRKLVNGGVGVTRRTFAPATALPSSSSTRPRTSGVRSSGSGLGAGGGAIDDDDDDANAGSAGGIGVTARRKSATIAE